MIPEPEYTIRLLNAHATWHKPELAGSFLLISTDLFLLLFFQCLCSHFAQECLFHLACAFKHRPSTQVEEQLCFLVSMFVFPDIAGISANMMDSPSHCDRWENGAKPRNPHSGLKKNRPFRALLLRSVVLDSFMVVFGFFRSCTCQTLAVNARNRVKTTKFKVTLSRTLKST